MEAFVLGVMSSLLATGLTLLGGWLASPGTHSWLMIIASRLAGHGIWRVVPRQRQAGQQIRDELSRARWVRVLAGRGNELTRDTFAPIWTDTDGRIESVHILLPDSRTGSGSWLSRREDDMRQIDPGFTQGLLAEQIRVNAAYIGQIARNSDAVSLRYYDLPNIHRLVITDRAAFITFYKTSEHGRNCPTLLARRPGLMYDYALTLFSTAWPHSRAETAPQGVE